MALIIAIIVIINQERKIIITESYDEDFTQYLLCEADKVSDHPLLDYYGEQKTSFKIRNKFKNEKIENISFIISRQFDTKEDAKIFTDEVHANFNKYTSRHNIPRSDVEANYSYIDNTGKISINIDKANLNYLTMPLVDTGIDMLHNASIEEYKNHYARNEYKCYIK